MIKKRVAVSWILLAIIVLSVTILVSGFISFRIYSELRIMENFLGDVCIVEEKCNY